MNAVILLATFGLVLVNGFVVIELVGWSSTGVRPKISVGAALAVAMIGDVIAYQEGFGTLIFFFGIVVPLIIWIAMKSEDLIQRLKRR